MLTDINNIKKTEIGAILFNFLTSLTKNKDGKDVAFWISEYKKYLDKTKDPNELLLSQVYDYYYLYHFVMLKEDSFLKMITHAYTNLYS
jgi:hypothetical protein